MKPDYLIEQLESSDSTIYQRASAMLVAYGPASLPALWTAVNAQQGRRCWRAVTTLSQIDHPDVWPMLCAALHLAHPLVNQMAVEAICAMDHPDCIVVLSEALPTSHTITQMAIIQALGQIKAVSAVPVLVDFLLTTESDSLRYTALQALGRMGDTSVMSFIASYIGHPNKHVHDHAVMALDQLSQTISRESGGLLMPHALIIDDDVLNLEVLSIMLEKEGVTCVACQTMLAAEKALEDEQHLDLVFLDLELPGQDGFQLFEKLSQHPRLREATFVAYTVHTSEIDVARRVGFHSFLGKPLDMRRFSGQLARILKREHVWEV